LFVHVIDDYFSVLLISVIEVPTSEKSFNFYWPLLLLKVVNRHLSILSIHILHNHEVKPYKYKNIASVYWNGSSLEWGRRNVLKSNKKIRLRFRFWSNLFFLISSGWLWS